MSQPRSDTSEVKALLQSGIAALAAELCPEGHRSGKYWLCRSEAHGEKVGGMWIEISGPRPGAWCDAVADRKGDVLQLIGYKRGLADFRDVMKWARGWLGLEAMDPKVRASRIDQARTRQAASEKDREEELEKSRKIAFSLYLNARKAAWSGSPADLYLKTRGIDVSALGKMPGCLGWLPEQKHHDTGTVWPCMLAGFSDTTGQHSRVVAIHRTFLKPDGSGKAPIEPQRKIWPSFKGAAIQIWRGETGMPAPKAAEQGLLDTLALCEGVEDGLSIALACPHLRVWAAGSLGNLAEIKIPACAERVIVFRDNDWSKPQAARLFDKAINALVAQQPNVSVACSSVGKDVNDALQSA